MRRRSDSRSTGWVADYHIYTHRPTVEARKDLIKEISKLCENARISVRSARHTAQKQIKADMDSKTVSSSEGKAEMKKVSTCLHVRDLEIFR